MTGKQHAVMWLGLLLIVFRLFTSSQWMALKSIFQMGPGWQNQATKPGGILGSPTLKPTAPTHWNPLSGFGLDPFHHPFGIL
jgi:hypothetical protein